MDKFCFFITIFFFSFGICLKSQNCDINVKGEIIDEHNGGVLEYAQIWIPELEIGKITDSTGLFILENICKGSYHFEISHIGCESRSYYINVNSDTLILFNLEHHGELLNELTISDKNLNLNNSKSKFTISEDRLRSDAGKPLGELMNRVPGVNSLKSGNGISKPMIHGLYGNRIGIINLGSPQEGQQWGLDHAPELDPFSIGVISIIKGSAAVRYGMSAMGGAIVLEPKPLPKDPHFHGRILTGYQTNGRLKTFNSQLEKSFNKFSIRFTGTLKAGGDQSTPDYYLTNTGIKEQNFAIHIGKSTISKWNVDFIYSLFNTEIGILRGSQVGNLTDLNEAIGRNIPFFTNEKYSSKINAPRQKVTHHNARIKSQYFLNDNKFFELILSSQYDQRQEFDVRRLDRSDIPSLNLSLFSFFQDLLYVDNSMDKFNFQIGIQNKLSNNINDAETGVIPLIPNYGLWNVGLFGSAGYKYNRLTLESGLRFDFQRLNAVFYKGNDLVDQTRNFNNVAFNAGLNYSLSSNFSIKWDNSYVSRAPFVNELYSYGLHQGVSGIEEGNDNLNVEKSIKSVIDLILNIDEKFELNTSLFFQKIDNFIYLSPQEDYRLTIRGAFPVFKYIQEDVNMMGVDFLSTVYLKKNISLESKLSWLKSENRKTGYAIIYMPPFYIENGLKVGIAKLLGVKDIKMLMSGRYVAKQVNVKPDEDFLEVPSSYFLTNISFSGKFSLFHNETSLSVSCNNLFDVNYRDYLSRLRYFSEEPGRTINFVLNYKF